MYRRISVHLDQGFDCKRRTQAAIGLAKRHQAELVGIYATSAPPQYYYGESVLMSRALNVMKDLQAQGRDSVRMRSWRRPRRRTSPPSSAATTPRPAPAWRCTDASAT